MQTCRHANMPPAHLYTMEDLLQFETKIGLHINDYELFGRALTHSSHLNENAGIGAQDNERLEFLGDAVLDFVVGDYLFRRFRDVDEGELTSLRAALVKTPTLAGFARSWELGSFLRLGQGEEDSGGRNRTPILCAAFEAVMGAVYLDQGVERVRELIIPLLEPTLDVILAGNLHKDSKSEFQVWAQAEYNITPHYVDNGALGPDHEKTFIVQVWVGEQLWGEGRGTSKRVAAQAAAKMGLKKAKSR